MSCPIHTSSILDTHSLTHTQIDNSYIIMQPINQLLPDESYVNNPYYYSKTKKSYWTYKIMRIFDNSSTDACRIIIPIFKGIHKELLTIRTKTDSQTKYQSVPYEIDTSPLEENNFNTIIIDLNNRLTQGSTLFIQFEIYGNYPYILKAFDLELNNGEHLFTNQFIFQVPNGNASEDLIIKQIFTTTYKNDTKELFLKVQLYNKSNYTLQNLDYQQIIQLPKPLSFVYRDLNHPLLKPTIKNMQELHLTGVIQTLDPYEKNEITCLIPFESESIPGKYLIKSDIVLSTNKNIWQESSSLNYKINKLATNVTYTHNKENTIQLTLSLSNLHNSMNALIQLKSILIVPEDTSIEFLSFGCLKTKPPLQLGTTIIGHQKIELYCQAVPIDALTTVQNLLCFKLIKTTHKRRLTYNIVHLISCEANYDLFVDSVHLPFETGLLIE